jgi:hypothetical protein
MKEERAIILPRTSQARRPLMKRRVLGFVLVTALLVAVSTIAAACGDGDDEVTREEGDAQVAVEDGEEELTLEEYFQQIDALGHDANARFDAVFEVPGVFEEPGPTRDALKESDALYEDVLDKFDDIDPPDEVRQAHNDFRDAIVAQQELFQDLAGEVADLQSTSELQQVLESRDAELAAAFAQTNAACFAQQAVADDNGIVVDLECEDE